MGFVNRVIHIITRSSIGAFPRSSAETAYMIVRLNEFADDRDEPANLGIRGGMASHLWV